MAREYQYTTNGNVLIKLAIVGAMVEQLEYIKKKELNIGGKHHGVIYFIFTSWFALACNFV